MTTEIERLEELLEKANQGLRESYSTSMKLAWLKEANGLRDALVKARQREAYKIMLDAIVDVMSSPRPESE